MGVIQRQSIKQSIVSYIGVIIGALSIFFIYPQAEEAYGMARFVIDTSQILVSFILLGSGGVAIKFFPQIQNYSKAAKGFLLYLLGFAMIGGSIVTVIFWLSHEQLVGLYDDRPDFVLLKTYFPYLLPIAILVSLIALFSNYAYNVRRIVVPAILNQLFIKVSLPMLILLIISGMADYRMMIWGILVTYALVLVGIVLYLIYLKRWDVSWHRDILSVVDHKRVLKYASYSLFTGIGGIVAYRIDSYMISTLIDFKSNGIYGICLFIGGVIAIPTNAINQISGPMISDALHRDDIKSVNGWYKNASINLLVMGGLVFILLALLVKELFLLMPKYESSVDQGVIIVLIIAAAKLIDMAASVNNQIIGYSKYYRFSLYTVLSLALLNIALNLYLIPKFQIIGAALATFGAITVNNLIKLGFVFYRYKIQPFTVMTIKLILIGLICYIMGYYLPNLDSHLLNIIITSIIVGLLYIVLVYKLKVSPEINLLLDQIIEKIYN